MGLKNGLTVVCQKDGQLKSVIRDDFELFSNEDINSFFDIIRGSEAGDFAQLFSDISKTRAIYQKDIFFDQDSGKRLFSVLVTAYGNDFAIIASPSQEELYFYYYEFINKLYQQLMVHESNPGPAEISLELAFLKQSFDKLSKEKDISLEDKQASVHEIQRLIDLKDKELKSKKDELNQFAHTISHDLKAPLSQSKLIVHLLRKRLEEEDEQKDTRQLLDMLLLSTDHLTNIIDTIHKYSRSGLFDNATYTFSSKELFEEVIGDLNVPPLMRIHLPASFPDITASRVQLVQVLSQLISNAIRYHHRADGNITLSFVDSEREYQFEVQDDGPGIPNEYHQEIFELFNTRRRGNIKEGTGVGLSIVKKLVENAGGKLELDSKVGRGSRFAFTWPKLQKT